MKIYSIINVNNERMSWEYPDITFSQVYYLATGKWRDIKPMAKITYKHVWDDGHVFEKILEHGKTVDVIARTGMTHFHVS